MLWTVIRCFWDLRANKKIKMAVSKKVILWYTIVLRAEQLPSVLWRCWLGDRKGIGPVKTEWWGAGVVICLERGADLHMAQLMPLPLTVSCFTKIQIGFTFLVLAMWLTRIVLDKGPLNVCACVSVRACVHVWYWAEYWRVIVVCVWLHRCWSWIPSWSWHCTPWYKAKQHSLS